jgi:hypothetical protein
VTVSLSALPLPTPTALPAGDGTRLRHTEQYACLAYAGDGAQDVAHLKGSLPLQLNGLAAALSATPLANLSWFWCDKSGENAVDFDANAVQVSWRSLGAARFLLLSRGGGLAGGVSRRVVRAGLAGGWCGPG